MRDIFHQCQYHIFDKWFDSNKSESNLSDMASSCQLQNGICDRLRTKFHPVFRFGKLTWTVDAGIFCHHWELFSSESDFVGIRIVNFCQNILTERTWTWKTSGSTDIPDRTIWTLFRIKVGRSVVTRCNRFIRVLRAIESRRTTRKTCPVIKIFIDSPKSFFRGIGWIFLVFYHSCFSCILKILAKSFQIPQKFRINLKRKISLPDFTKQRFYWSLFETPYLAWLTLLCLLQILAPVPGVTRVIAT